MLLCVYLPPTPEQGTLTVQAPNPRPTQDSGRYEHTSRLPGAPQNKGEGSTGRKKPLCKCKVLIVKAISEQASHLGPSLLDKAFLSGNILC